ncbi:uncharacterized protein LOC144443796 [Glandiceps talaboti]
MKSSLRQIIVSRFTGLAEVEVKLTSIRLATQDDDIDDVSMVTIDHHTAMEILLKLLRKNKYIGCSRCHQQLKQDNNNVYLMCSRCVPRSNSNEPPHCQCFRTMYFSLTNDSYTVECEVSPSCINKVVLGIVPDLVTSKLGLTCFNTAAKENTEKLALCLTHLLEPAVTIQCNLHCYTPMDENSVPLDRTFHLHNVKDMNMA